MLGSRHTLTWPMAFAPDCRPWLSGREPVSINHLFLTSLRPIAIIVGPRLGLRYYFAFTRAERVVSYSPESSTMFITLVPSAFYAQPSGQKFVFPRD